MKIYIAAPYAARPLVVGFAEILTALGHTCTSTWANSTRTIHEGTVGPTHEVDQPEVARHAEADFNDIDRAEALILLTGNFITTQDDNIPDAWLHTGGRHVEVGYALATGKPVVAVGEPENVFQRGLCLGADSFMLAVEVLEEDHAHRTNTCGCGPD